LNSRLRLALIVNSGSVTDLDHNDNQFAIV
jgi:hypothetical protein